MNLRRMGLESILVGCVLLCACSSGSNSNNPGAAGGSTGAVGGGTGTQGGSGSGGTGAVAGSSGTSDGREEVWVEASNLASCDDICTEAGHECAAVCGDNNTTAADTLYTYFSASGMNLNEQRQFGSCADAVDQVLTYNGNDYVLVTLRCCCLAVPVQRIDGDPALPVTCNELCATKNLVCHEDTNWDSLATSGMMATYTTASSVRYIPGDCTDVPAATVNRVGVDEPLTAYRCGCVAP